MPVPYQLAIIESNELSSHETTLILDEMGTHYRIPTHQPFVLSEPHGKLVVIASSVRNNWIGFFILEEVKVIPL